MHLLKLLDDDGQQITEPQPAEATVSWDIRDGVAQAWSVDGRTLLAEMRNARVVWIGASGLRLEGMEPVGTEGRRLRAMAWQVRF